MCALGADLTRARRPRSTPRGAWRRCRGGAARGDPRGPGAGGWFARGPRLRRGPRPRRRGGFALADRANAGVGGLRAVVMRWVTPLREAPRGLPSPATAAPGGRRAFLAQHAAAGPAPPARAAAILRRLAEGDESAAWRGVERPWPPARAPGAGDAAPLYTTSRRGPTRGAPRAPAPAHGAGGGGQADDDWAWQQHSVALRRASGASTRPEAARRAAERREHPIHHASLAVVLKRRGPPRRGARGQRGRARRRPDDDARLARLAVSFARVRVASPSASTPERGPRPPPTHGPAGRR